MKIDYKLLLKIIALEITYSVVMFFALFFFLWGHFGEGAGAESPQAIFGGKIATCIILFPPIIFNFYKMFAPNRKQNLLTYLSAEIIIVLLFSYSYYKGFIGS